MSVSMWVWVAGGVIAGLIIFSIAYQQVSLINASRMEQRSLEEISEVKSLIDNLCWSFPGNKRKYKLELVEAIEGVYVAEKPHEYEREQLINKILSKEEGRGRFFCLKVSDKRLRCEELECNTSMTFLGSVPEKFSLSALVNKLMGKTPTFVYTLEFNRTEEGVEVRAV